MRCRRVVLCALDRPFDATPPPTSKPMTFHLPRRLLFAALASTLGAGAWALEPAPVELTDGLALTPTLKLGAGYDDNFRAAENRKESSAVSTIAPTLAIGADNGKLKFDARYTANHEIYHSSRKDDNTDHLFDTRIELQPDARNRFSAKAGYRKIEETATADQKVENDRFNSTNVGGTYTYGADSATGQLRLGLNHDRLRYDNGLNPAGGGRLNADKERDSNAYVGAFLYRIAPKTKAVLEGRYTQHEYRSNTALDSNNKALLLGAEWEATAFTTGSLRIGRERKDFDLASKGSASTGMWEAAITWSPLTYSSFTLNTRAGFDEGSDGADAIDTRSVTLAWSHDWTERVNSKLSYNRSDQDFDRPTNPREDQLDSLSLGISYKLRRWLDVGVGYKYTENDSTQSGKSYQRNVVGLTLDASM